MEQNLSAKVQELSRTIGYQFNDPARLILALTHKSALRKVEVHGEFDNERLEFLGDAVLSLVAADYLFAAKMTLDEGDLSRLRAQYVCKDSLAHAAKNIKLYDFIISDKAMRASGGLVSPSVLADTLEATFGAVFVDGGLECAARVIFKVLGVPSLEQKTLHKDAKTRLQEWVQSQLKTSPKYQVLGRHGPEHAPEFLVGVSIAGTIICSASGENKKNAEQNAARLALENLQADSVIKLACDAD